MDDGAGIDTLEEKTLTATLLPPALHLVRLPGEHGPILRCTGELSVATVEALRRELALLEPLGHPVLILNLSGCRSLDAEGILTLLQSFNRLRQAGRRLAIVAGMDWIARILQATRIDEIIPVFPTESVAALALRGGGPPPPAPDSWRLAHARTLARWRAIQAALDKVPMQKTLHDLTSMMALCERAEEIYQEQPTPTGARCQFCPLFHELGGEPGDVGCRSLLDPIMEMLRTGRREGAKEGIAFVVSFLEQMPLPEDLPHLHARLLA
jgi:anti-anti-sigma factor